MAVRSLDPRRIKVLLLESIHPSALEALEASGYANVSREARALPEGELADRLRDVQILGVRSRTRISEEVLKQAPLLFAIGCFSIGTDRVDLEAAERRGIPVFNAPFSNTRSVAELVLAEIVMLCRGVPQRNAAAHAGRWQKTRGGGKEVRGKRLGIVGYGHIGTQVGVLAEAVGMRVAYYDIERKLALGNAEAVGSLDALLESCDVITLHVPDSVLTRGMIGQRELGRLRPGAHLINASRGSIVDLDALAAALDSGRVAGAAIDVFPSEPGSDDEEFVSPLRRFDNVILTPHIAGSTEEAQASIGREVAEQLVRYSDNGSTLGAVNFPQVGLPEHSGKHRLLHVHRNEPGMLARVNAAISEAGINIASQYLETDRHIGYAVIDIDGAERPVSQAVRRKLDEIDGTIRTRVLY